MLRTMLTRRMPIKGPRTKKCAVKTCRALFVPEKTFITWCSPECGHAIAVAKLAKQKTAQARASRKAVRDDKAETKKKLDAMRPRKWFLAKAKTALHAYIRARDEGKPCISCDTILLKLGRPGGDYDAGHFRSVGSAKHLQFEEGNIFGQCKHCNDHLKGNQLEYERRLRILKGDAYVDAIKADNDARHLTIHDFLQIEATYTAKLRTMKEAI